MTTPRWDEHADWWQREFTDGADPEYVEQIIPLAVAQLTDAVARAAPDRPGLIVDVGTGEGQVARVVARATGATVVGVDPTGAQVRLGARRGGAVAYVQAGADGLAVADGVADAVLVCLVYEHVDDLDSALAEAARVLRPGGRLVFFLNHPLLQTPGSGMIIDHMLEPPETYWRIGPYLPEAETVEEVQKGVFVRFLHRPLSRYVNALRSVGLTLVHMDEPAPPPGFLAKAPEYESEVVATTPRLLLLVAEKTEPV